MAVVAYGTMAMIGAASILAVIVGAAGGAAFWKAKHGLALGGSSVLGVYLFAIAVVLGASWPGAALLGVAPLILTFLVACLTARYLNVHANLRPIWATLAALGAAWVVGFLVLLLLRFNLWASLWITTGVDAGLMLLAARRWKLAAHGVPQDIPPMSYQ